MEAEVASREFRNNTRALLRRVEAGETITLTAGGRPVAVLSPLSRRPKWMGRDEFVSRLSKHQADPGLDAQLRDLIPDTTDDVPVP